MLAAATRYTAAVAAAAAAASQEEQEDGTLSASDAVDLAVELMKRRRVSRVQRRCVVQLPDTRAYPAPVQEDDLSDDGFEPKAKAVHTVQEGTTLTYITATTQTCRGLKCTHWFKIEHDGDDDWWIPQAAWLKGWWIGEPALKIPGATAATAKKRFKLLATVTENLVNGGTEAHWRAALDGINKYVLRDKLPGTAAGCLQLCSAPSQPHARAARPVHGARKDVLCTTPARALVPAVPCFRPTFTTHFSAGVTVHAVAAGEILRWSAMLLDASIFSSSSSSKLNLEANRVIYDAQVTLPHSLEVWVSINN